MAGPSTATGSGSRFGLDGALSHLSSGGGATLALIERGDLPGLPALRRGWTPVPPSGLPNSPPRPPAEFGS